MKRIWFSALAILGLVAGGRAESVYFDDIKIPMRDGVNLAADVYLPSNRTGKVGCLLEFSPYQVTKASSASVHGTDRAEAWGVAQVWVDCRGLCHSEGVFEPWEKRLTDDAFDLLEWISRQEWSNGRVATVGGSYPGWTQLACLKSGHPALVAAAPSVITFGAYTVSFQNGVLAPIFQQGWHTSQAGADSWAELARHPDRNDFYWRDRESLGRLSKSKARVFLQAGWFDMLGVETFKTFDLLPKGSIVRVGPWSHGINTFDRPDFSYADKNAEVTEELEDEFLRSALEGRESSLVAAQPRIQVYTMGRNVWRELDAWPARGTTDRRLYLSASEGARSLVWENPRVGSAAFDYYPDDPTPAKGGRVICAGGQYDQREIEARADVLSFTSDVLAEELEVTGDVRASLNVASTAPESDVVVRLVDVCPDGRALGVLEGIYRAKFLLGRSRRVDWFLDITSYVFQPGHRIRVDIAGAAAPHFAKSPNAATETVALGGADASCVILPVLLTDPTVTKEASAVGLSKAETPTARPQPGWKERFEANCRQIKAAAGKIDLVFLGDSITHYWDVGEGPDSSTEIVELRKTYSILNCAYGGDKVQNQLWVTQNGLLDGYQAKLVMIHIGTNNSGMDMDPAETFKGIKALVATVREKQPQAKILLLNIFPRATFDDKTNVLNRRVNALINAEKWEDAVMVKDIGANFVDEKGDTIPELFDEERLHFVGTAGYARWRKAVEPIFKDAVGK